MRRRRHVCGEYAGRMVDLINRELTADEEHKLSDELRACPACMSELAALRSMRSAFQSALESARPTDEYWTGYERRLRERIDAAEGQPMLQPAAVWRWPTFWSWSAGIAAAAISVLAVATWLPRDRPHGPVALVGGQQQTAALARPAPPPLHPRAAGRRSHRSSGILARTAKAVSSDHPVLDMLMAPGPLPLLMKQHAESVRIFLTSVLKEGGLSNSNRVRARFLLTQNQLIRREAEARGDLANQEQLVRLEPVLLDVVHMGSTGADAISEYLQQRIRDEEPLLLVLGSPSGEDTPQ
jgi:hypothetical protein